MAITYDWTIPTCEYEIATGGINVVHWRCTAQDGDYTASSYGTLRLTPNPSTPDFKPYNQVTKDDVLSWLRSGLDKETIRETLANEIESLKNPLFMYGTPW